MAVLYANIGGAWVPISAAAPTPWTAVTFSGAWVNQGAGFQNCEYRREGDRVWLRGSAKGGAIGPVCVLPVGFRPPTGIQIFSVDATNAHSRVDVRVDGTVYVQTGTLTWLSLDGITFSTVT